MKKFLLLYLLALTMFSCKEESECEGWLSGFESYETTDGGNDPFCSTPLLKGWKPSTSNTAAYTLEITVQQGFHHLFINSTEDAFFQVGDEFDLSGTQTSQYFTPNSFWIDTDDQHVIGDIYYWSPVEGHVVITGADEASGKVSLVAEYTLSRSSDVARDGRSFRVEINDYAFPFNPR